MSKTAVVFPGQGSQYLGMAGGFIAENPDAAALMARAEETSGLPLGRLCSEGPMEELTRTLHLQPAMTVVNLIVWEAFRKAGGRADFLAGHSLGEYAALAASGILDNDAVLRLVTERGRLMEREASAHPGGMVAALGLDIDAVQEIVAATGGRITAANHNCATQIVISGEKEALERASEAIRERGGKAIPLKVSGPWHSELVADAIPDFVRAMEKEEFRTPAIPVYFNVTAAVEENPEIIRGIMARQIASTVRWYEIVNRMIEDGVRTFVELGPKTVLSGLIKKIVDPDLGVRILQADTPESVEEVAGALA